MFQFFRSELADGIGIQNSEKILKEYCKNIARIPKKFRKNSVKDRRHPNSEFRSQLSFTEFLWNSLGILCNIFAVFFQNFCRIFVEFWSRRKLISRWSSYYLQQVPIKLGLNIVLFFFWLEPQWQDIQHWEYESKLCLSTLKAKLFPNLFLLAIFNAVLKCCQS